MKAIILKDFGGVEQLEYKEIPRPIFKPDEVLIRIKAFALNPVDVKTRMGKGQAAKLKLDNPMILGWDVSGIVEECGEEVTSANSTPKFFVGDEVFGMVNLPGTGKAYAEFVAAPAAHLTIKPKNISHQEAAAAGIAAVTAYQALYKHGSLKAGDKILIHAAAGGVGHYAVQMAKEIGAYVIGTSSAANKEFVMQLGADEHIDYKQDKFENVCPQVDMVLDTIGGDNIDRSLKVLKPGGTIIALPSGLSESVSEKAGAQGKTGIFFFAQSNAADMKSIADLLESGAVHSYVTKEVSFDSIRAAHDLQGSGNSVGKIVINV